MTKRTILMILLLVAATSPLSAQERNANWAQYQDQKKSEVAALVLEILIPTVGHAYAGNWAKGLIPFGVTVAGYTTAFVGAAECADHTGDCTGGENAKMLSGLIVGIGGQIWGMVSAYRTAENHNNELRERYGIETGLAIRPAYGGRAELAITIRGLGWPRGN